MTTIRVPERGWADFKVRLHASTIPAIVSAIPDEATRERVVTWEPPLTLDQQAIVKDWMRACNRGMTDAEWSGVRSVVDGLKTYHGLNSPTNLQTVQAVKALIRLVLRDDG
jgi:hypothetical protein